MGHATGPRSGNSERKIRNNLRGLNHIPEDDWVEHELLDDPGFNCPPQWGQLEKETGPAHPVPALGDWSKDGALLIQLKAFFSEYINETDSSGNLCRMVKHNDEVDLWGVIKAGWKRQNGVEPIITEGHMWLYQKNLGIWAKADTPERLYLFRLLHGLSAGDGYQDFDGKTIMMNKRNLLALDFMAMHDHAIINKKSPFADEVPGVVLLTNLQPERSPAYSVKQTLIHMPDKDGHVHYMAPGFEEFKRHTYNEPTPRPKLSEVVNLRSEKNNPAAWHHYMKSLFAGDDDAEAKVQTVEEHLGASLCGLATKFQRVVVLEGSGANGKSLFMEIARRLFNAEDVTVTSPDTWGRFGTVDLMGKKINLVTELDEGSVFKSDTFKSAVTGDLIRGEYKGGASFSFRPVAGHILSCNSLPPAADQSPGFYRRFILVKFGRRWSHSDPGYREADQILDSIMEVRHEIVQRLVWSCAELMKRGQYPNLSSHNSAMKDWAQNSDSVTDFANSCLKKDDEGDFIKGIEKQPELHGAFLVFTKNTGRKGMGNRNFYRRLAAIEGVDKREKHYNGSACFNVKLNYQADWLEGSKDI